MDFPRFFKLLKRFIWVLVLIPILAVCFTYYFVQDLPKEYASQALVSTGIADRAQGLILDDSQRDYFAVNQQFTNIIEHLTMKKNINLLSYKLILHDLSNPGEAFAPLPEVLSSLDSSDMRSVISEYRRFLAEERIITPEDNGVYPLYDFLGAMGYNEEAILDKLEIVRKGDSDLIQVNFLSNNPYLSVYVVNTVANDFINSYRARSVANQTSSKVLLDSLLQGKEASMNAKNAQIQSFQVENQAIDLMSRAESLSGQIAEKEAQRAGTLGEIQSLVGAIQGIDNKLKNRNSDLLAVNVVENNQILTLKDQLQKANERFVDNDFQPRDAQMIDSLQSRLSKLIANSTNSSTGSDPRVLRQSLIQQKLTMEVELDRAKSGLGVITGDLARLKSQYSKMVPSDAGLKNFEREAAVATQEYLNALELHNKNSVLGSTNIRPQLAQAGVVNPAEPSKQIVYMGLAAIGAEGTVIFALFLAFLLDRRVWDSEQLIEITDKRLLGVVNKIVPNDKDLKTIWEDNNNSKDYIRYKDLVRSLRFEVEELLRAEKKQIIGIVGLYDNSGASFIASSLAYSFAMTKKRVLLIGGDYELDKSDGKKKITSGQFFDSYIEKREIFAEELITKLTTDAKSDSLLESYSVDVLENGFEELKKNFDIIIIDAQSLQKVHRAKEWLMFSDRSFAVYPAGQSIGQHEKDLIKYMNKQEGFMGWVLNRVKLDDLGVRQLVH